MIGNDIVDLMQSRRESNWQRKGFLEKVFTADEQLLIANDPEHETMVWLLWSMKEAAYKIYNRQTKIREYIPKKLTCTILSKDSNHASGQVACLENTYHTETAITKNSIHTVAVSSIANLKDVIEIENKGIIKDRNGMPCLPTVQNVIQDVSISHHGRFEKVVAIRMDVHRKS